MKARIISNRELYGTDDVPPVPADVCSKRIELLQAHLEKLLSVGFMKQDNYKINRVLKAIEFWRAMGAGESDV